MQKIVGLCDETKRYIETLESENSQLRDTVKTNILQFERYERSVTRLEKENAYLAEKLKLALLRQFYRHAEKFTGTGQPLLFEGGEKAAPAKEEPKEDTVAIPAHMRSKRGRKPLSESLPREHTYLDIEENEKECACGHSLTCIGEETSERLHIVPQQVWVEVIHKKKYACHECEGSGDEDKPAVRMAETPGNIMPGSIATAGLLSFIFTQKYCDYLPFYRQEAAFGRIGVKLSRQNMSNWQQKVCKKISPLLTLIKEQVKAGKVIQMDETTMAVMDEPGRENKQVSYMWLARGGPPGKQAVWYEYQESHASKHITEILSGYSGFLQTDGYEAYETALKELPGIIHIGCMAHARRKFYEAMKISGGKSSAEAALSQIKGLYTVEKDLREKLKTQEINAEQFQKQRKERCEPMLNAFHDWLEKEQREVLGSSKLGEAAAYTLGQWPKLARYLDDAELTPDNNACERSIRPFVMGRKNWVMSGSPEGAQSSCQLYSLIETAKANNRNPYVYLKTVFEHAAEINPGGDWEKLLPWNLSL